MEINKVLGQYELDWACHTASHKDYPYNKLKNKTVYVAGTQDFFSKAVVYFLFGLNDLQKLNIKITLVAESTAILNQIFPALLKVLFDGRDVYPYNISAEHSNVTIRNFARKAVEAFPERNLTLSFANKEDEKEPELSVMGSTPEILDSTRLNNIGWQAKVDLTEGIKRAVKIVELQNS